MQNRIIEFRAWDKSNKIMHYDFKWIDSGNKNNEYIIFSSDKQKKYDDYIANPFFKDQFEIMQFTGLLDKNGKKIFEADILKIKYINYQGSKKEYIEREFITKAEFFEFMSSFCFIEDEEYCFFNHRSMEIEVIGNIFEN